MTATPRHPEPEAGESADGWRLERHPHGRLDFIDALGARHANVDVVRAFPVSAPTGAAAIVTAAGEELAWIGSLAALAGPLRRILETELSQREFLPVIERIESISDGEPAEWSVLTDRGRHRFKVAHAEDITPNADGSVFVTDSFGMRYRIPHLSDLDARSRRLLDSTL